MWQMLRHSIPSPPTPSCLWHQGSESFIARRTGLGGYHVVHSHRGGLLGEACPILLMVGLSPEFVVCLGAFKFQIPVTYRKSGGMGSVPWVCLGVDGAGGV